MASKAVVIFKAVDKIFDGQQNNRRMTKCYKQGVEVEKDIVYYAAEPEACKLDLYYKKSETKNYPVLFYIHGGGFVAGDKKYRRALSCWYASNGFFVVNVNHGLAPKYKFPAPIIQLTEAVNWVADNAEKYGLDLSKFIVSGDSAGGYYSAMMACLTNNEKLQQRYAVTPKAKFTGTILNCGIYDMPKALEQKVLFNLTDSICMDFASIHKEEFRNFEYIDAISPIDFIDENFPKAFVTYAEQDFFCRTQGETLVEKLKQFQPDVAFYGSTKFSDNHTFSLTWKTPAARENNDLTMAWARKFAGIDKD